MKHDFQSLGTEVPRHPSFACESRFSSCRCSGPRHATHGCIHCYNVTLEAAADTGGVLAKIRYWLYKI